MPVIRDNILISDISAFGQIGARKSPFKIESVPKTVPLISTVTTPPGRCL